MAKTGFRTMRLVMRPTGLTVLCNRPNLVMGRHRSADIRLPLPDVSRRHCRLAFTPAAGWRVIDMDSLNGISVNGERVTVAELRPGDHLSVGGFSFEIDLPDERLSDPEIDLNHQHVLRSIADSLPPV